MFNPECKHEKKFFLCVCTSYFSLESYTVEGHKIYIKMLQIKMFHFCVKTMLFILSHLFSGLCHKDCLGQSEQSVHQKVRKSTSKMFSSFIQNVSEAVII